MGENYAPKARALFWVGSSKRDLLAFPPEVQRRMGFALRFAQQGGAHPDAKPLKGFAGASVMEVPVRYESDAYRTVYTVTLATGVYVRHAFQKKSKRGIQTPKVELDLVRSRLKAARDLDAAFHGEQQQERGV